MNVLPCGIPIPASLHRLYTLYNRNDMIRAVYEGTYALRTVLDVYRENRLSFKDMILIGGGAKSRLWTEMLLPYLQPSREDTPCPGVATTGCAIAAGVGAGMFKDFAAALDQEFETVHAPDPEQHEKYEEYYKVFRTVYPDIKPVYDRIAQLREQQ